MTIFLRPMLQMYIFHMTNGFSKAAELVTEMYAFA